MSDHELAAALETVHRELSDADHLDQEDVQNLQATMLEIQTALEQKKEPEAKSLSDRMYESARRFEESHPKLTETLGRIADTLQQMGI